MSVAPVESWTFQRSFAGTRAAVVFFLVSIAHNFVPTPLAELSHVSSMNTFSMLLLLMSIRGFMSMSGSNCSFSGFFSSCHSLSFLSA